MIEIVSGSFSELESAFKEYWLLREPYLPDMITDEVTYQSKYGDVVKYYQSVQVFMAKEDGQYVGRVCACIDRNGAEGFIKGIYVNSEYRCKGIGKRLLQEANVWLKERGCIRIVLYVVRGNEKVLDFYKKCGYEVQAYCMFKGL